MVTTTESRTRTSGRFRIRGRGVDTGGQVERCAAGRLRDAYPAGARDLELRIIGDVTDDALAALLRDLVDAIQDAEPHCRRVVYAAPADAPARTAAEDAGFRYVVDVDLADEQVGLLVAEPEWVRAADTELDHVPGS